MSAVENKIEIGCSSDGRTVWILRVRGASRTFIRRKRRGESMKDFLSASSEVKQCWFKVVKEGV